MKILSEKKALQKLAAIRTNFTAVIRLNYEDRAKSCLTCQTPGACCLDEHFVNVHISRLEAAAIREVLGQLPAETLERVEERIVGTMNRYALTSAGDTFTQTFACPLFEKGVGCLVHSTAKPLPCIQHACYENAADLPPDEMLADAENAVGELNRRTYRSPQPTLPLPLAIMRKTRT